MLKKAACLLTEKLLKKHIKISENAGIYRE